MQQIWFGDIRRSCQTMVHSSVLVAASQTWVVKPFINKKEKYKIQNLKVKMLVEVIEVLVLII